MTHLHRLVAELMPRDARAALPKDTQLSHFGPRKEGSIGQDQTSGFGKHLQGHGWIVHTEMMSSASAASDRDRFMTTINKTGACEEGQDAQNSDVVPGGASLRVVAAFSAPPQRERTRISRNSHRNEGKRGRSGPQVPFAGAVKLAIQSPSSVNVFLTPKSLGGDLCVPELQHPGPLESLNSPVLQVCQCERSTANKIDLRPLHLNIRIITTAFPSFLTRRHI
ncbi:hypothetical protein KCU85_g473, partial [Aureobasidium melanogenum]